MKKKKNHTKRTIIRGTIIELLLLGVFIHSQYIAEYGGYFTDWAFVIYSMMNLFLWFCVWIWLETSDNSYQSSKKSIYSDDMEGSNEISSEYQKRNRLDFQIIKWIIILLLLVGIYLGIRIRFRNTLYLILNGYPKKDILYYFESEWRRLWRDLSHLSYYIAGGIIALYLLFAYLSQAGSGSSNGSRSRPIGRSTGGSSHRSGVSRSNFYAGSRSSSFHSGRNSVGHSRGFGGGHGGGGTNFGGGAGRGRH